MKKKVKATKTVARKTVKVKKSTTARTKHTITSHMHPNTFLLVVAGGAFVIISILYMMMM